MGKNLYLMKINVSKYVIILPARGVLTDKFSFRNFISSCNQSCIRVNSGHVESGGVVASALS